MHPRRRTRCLDSLRGVLDPAIFLPMATGFTILNCLSAIFKMRFGLRPVASQRELSYRGPPGYYAAGSPSTTRFLPNIQAMKIETT